MAVAKTKVVIVDRKRDGSMSDVYVGAINSVGVFESQTIPLNKEVTMDINLIKSLKARKETVRETVGKVENLITKPIYSVETV